MSYDRHADAHVTKPVDLEGIPRVIRAIDDVWLQVVRLRKDPDAGG